MLKDNLHQIPLRAPVNLTWEITSRCNLHCKHCLSRDQMAECGKELTTAQAKNFIDQLVDFEVFQVNIGGGEPFLRQDIWELLAYCHEKQLVTCVSTNGSFIDQAAAKKLAQMKYMYMQVSLDGATAQTNDAIRGEGTYALAMQAVKNLYQEGFKGLSLNTVVTAKNFQELPSLYKLAKDYNCKPRLSRFRPSGGGGDMWQEYALNKAQAQELAQLLSEHRDIMTGDSFFSITREDRKNLGLNMCGACKMTCSVAPDGNMYPCAFMQYAEFLAGNILTEPFGEIWQNSPIMARFRSLEAESCKDCVRFDACHGGCPAIAWFIKQDIAAGDPGCICKLQ